MNLPSDPTAPEGMIWQTVTGTAGSQHAFLGASGWSVCGRQSRKEWRDSSPVPNPIKLCPICVDRILAATPADQHPTLPMEILGNTIAVQAYKAFRTLNPEARVIADLAKFCEDDLLDQPGFGEKCLTSLHEGLALVGLKPIPSHNHQSRSVLADANRQSAFKAQAERFLREVGLDGIQQWTLQQIGDTVGISRERVRQLFEANPALKLLRGDPGGHSRVLNRAVLEDLKTIYLEGKSSFNEATRRVGLKSGTVRKGAERDPALAELLLKGRKVRVATISQRIEARIIEIAEYAIAHGTSFKGACSALGLDHIHMGNQKNRRVPHLKEDPRYQDILAPEKRIAEDVRIARERILAGASIENACDGLKTSPHTVRRHLDKYPEVMAVINKRGSARKSKK